MLKSALLHGGEPGTFTRAGLTLEDGSCDISLFMEKDRGTTPKVTKPTKKSSGVHVMAAASLLYQHEMMKEGLASGDSAIPSDVGGGVDILARNHERWGLGITRHNISEQLKKISSGALRAQLCYMLHVRVLLEHAE